MQLTLELLGQRHGHPLILARLALFAECNEDQFQPACCMLAACNSGGNTCRCLLSVLFGYGLNGGERLCRLNIHSTIALADLQQLLGQLLMGSCQGIFALLAVVIRIARHDSLVCQTCLCPPPRSLGSAWDRLQGGKCCGPIICRRAHEQSGQLE